MSRLFLVTLSSLAVGILSISLVYADASAGSNGLKEGDPLGVFHVTKIAGAVDDAVEPGETLCYRCRYGSRPMVLIFARDIGGKVSELLKAVDHLVADHEDAKLKGLLTLIGEDAGVLKAEGEKIAEKTAVKWVPIAVAKETKTGPLNYKLSNDAQVTIVLAQDSQVVRTLTAESDAIDINAIIDGVKAMLN